MEKMHTMINEQTKNFIKFLPFRDIELWDVKRYASEKIKSDFPIVKLGLHIQEQNKKVKLFDFPEQEFGILGVNNKIGIFDAYKEKGANINQSYKRMEKNWLAYNPYRINVGSIGMRTEEHENEYISPAYVVFSCKNTLQPDFLFKLFKTERFNKIINESTTGSVRQNLTIEILKTLNIALPNPKEQIEILKKYYKLEGEAKSNEEEIIVVKKKIEDYLYKKLNISFKKNEINKGLSFVNSKSLNRWDVAYLSSIIELSSDYPTVKIEACLTSFLKDNENNSLRFESAKYPTEDFYFIGMEHIEKNSGDLQELVQVKGEEIKSQTIKVPNDFILYGKLRPYLNKYWVNNENYNNIICSSEFFVFDTNEKIEKDFFVQILGSSIIQHQIENNSSGARMPRINEDTFKNLEIPLPEKELQIEISNKIKSFKSDIKFLKEEAEKKRKFAIKEFEKLVFKK
jgi:type I restriction enzyme, S subunit